VGILEQAEPVLGVPRKKSINPIIHSSAATHLMPRVILAGTMQLAQRTLETLNLAFVIDLLALGEFQRLEHFLHFVERMFELLNDAVDRLDRIADGGRLVRRLLVMPLLLTFVVAARLFPRGLLAMSFLTVLVLVLVPLFMLLPFLGMFRGRFRGFGGNIARGWSFASCGRGQGTARLAAARMAAASASGATPASRCGGTSWFGG
jgi:hypothetical protein